MNEWIDIVEYRDFYDVPRIFLIVVDGRLFLFDCQFDDESDEYPDEYTVYELCNLPLDALPNDWTGLTHHATNPKGRVPIHNVRFDVSKRKQIKCNALRDFGLF